MMGKPTIQYVLASTCPFEETPAFAFATLFGSPHGDVDRLRAELSAFFHSAALDYMVDLDHATLMVVPGVTTSNRFWPDDPDHARAVEATIQALAQ